MDDYALSKVVSGCTLCEYNGHIIYIKQPPPIEYLLIHKKQHEIVLEAQSQNILTDDDLYHYLINCGLWSLEEQEKLDIFPTTIEKLKVELYNAYVNFKSDTANKIRTKLTKQKEDFLHLLTKRHILDSNTCNGLGSFTKSLYFIGYGAHTLDNKKIWPNEEFLTEDFQILLELMKQHTKESLTDDELRDIAKGQQWRSLWGLSKNPVDIFDVSSILYLNEEQRSLVQWTQLYDNILGSENCPDDNIIQDNDMLDGWLIVQNKNKGVVPTTDRYGKSAEVFIPVETLEDAQRVESLNSPQSKILKQQRLKMVQKLGQVSEQEFPDVKRAILQQALTQGVR